MWNIRRASSVSVDRVFTVVVERLDIFMAHEFFALGIPAHVDTGGGKSSVLDIFMAHEDTGGGKSSVLEGPPRRERCRHVMAPKRVPRVRYFVFSKISVNS